MAITVPLVDLKAQYEQIGPEIDAAIRRVIDSTSFILGPDVAAFETGFARFCGVDHCVGVASGTSAIELVLRAYGVGPGDEVITVAHTFIATAEAISAVGATPVFVDIDADTFTMSPAEFEAAITPKTHAVIPVHLYGHPAEMDRINEIAHQHDIVVIEDAAQAHGASWDGKRAGALGDAACFSFYPGKGLGAYGDAGAVVTNDEAIAAQVKSLRNHGRQSKYYHDQIGYGLRIDTLQAAILNAKLPYLEQWVQARDQIAKQYDELLADSFVSLPTVSPRAQHGWHLYVVRAEERDTLVDRLRENGIGAGVHYPVPLHLQPAYAHLGYSVGQLPVTEAVADTCLSLPIYPEMTSSQLELVVDALDCFISLEIKE